MALWGLWRVSATVILSVCLSIRLSVTTRYQFKSRWDSKLGVIPYDSLESLVFRDKISYRWVTGVPTNEGAKQGHPLPLKRRYSAAIGSSDVKMVANRQRHAAYHTSTGDELLRNVNTDDLEWPWTPKIWGFSKLFAILGCDTHFKNKLRRNGWR